MNIYWVLLKQAYYARREHGMQWAIGIPIGISVCMLCLGGIQLGNRELLLGGGLGLALVSLACIWLHLLTISFRQCTPTNSSLTPLLRNRLISLHIFSWLFLTALIATAWGWEKGGTPKYWSMTAWATLWLSWSMRSPRLAHHPLFFSAPAIPALGYFMWTEFGEHLFLISAHPLFMLFTVAAGCLSFYFQFAQGGDKHWRWQTDAAKRDQQLRAGVGAPSATSVIDKLSWYRQFPYKYFWSLKRDLTHNAPATKLIHYVFGPNIHMQSMIINITLSGLTVATVLAILLVALSLYSPAFKDFSIATLKGLTIPLSLSALIGWFFMQSLFPFILMSSAYHSRKEQALLSLSARIPQGLILNRQLALKNLKDMLCFWLIGACLVSVACLLLPDRPATEQAIRILCATLFIALLPIGRGIFDYARVAPSYWSETIKVFGLQAAVFICWILIDSKLFTFPVILLAILCVLSSFAYIAYRWRIAINAPSAFPAGRLAA